MNNASSGGPLQDVYDWLTLLLSCGPGFGYFPEPSKSYLVVPEYCRAMAKAMFQNLGVHVVMGHRFLGGYIGNLCGKDVFVQRRVDKWASDVHT